jgi:hypothetical protein
MSNEPLSTLFPELNDPQWIKQREECWQLALTEGDWKSEYRKKELEAIHHFFFTGNISERFPFFENNRMMLMLFPIQTKAGYDYYYQTHEFTAKQVESNFRSAFLSQQSSGMRWQEQKEYFNYHVGEVFELKKEFLVEKNVISFEVDPSSRFNQIFTEIFDFLSQDISMYPEKLMHMLPYFESVAEYMQSSNIDFGKVKKRLLPKLIARIENDEYLRSGDDLELIRKEMLDEVRPTFLRIKEYLNL